MLHLIRNSFPSQPTQSRPAPSAKGMESSSKVGRSKEGNTKAVSLRCLQISCVGSLVLCAAFIGGALQKMIDHEVSELMDDYSTSGFII